MMNIIFVMKMDSHFHRLSLMSCIIAFYSDSSW